MSLGSVFLVAVLALILGSLNMAIWVEAGQRARRTARRRRQVMRRHAMLLDYPGAVGTGCDDDPYLRPWVRAIERIDL